MTALEGCLIVIGVIAVVISYFISEKNAEERMKKAVDELVLSEETKQTLIKQAKDTVEETLNSMSDEISGKAEVQLEKISNEKIMMVHDYSDTVLEEIGKNHHEVMFLYSMLDDKDKDIKHTVREAQKIVKSIRELNQIQEYVGGQVHLQPESYLKKPEDLEENLGKNITEKTLNKDFNKKTEKSLEKAQKSVVEKESKNENKSLARYQKRDSKEELEGENGLVQEENKRSEKRRAYRYLERMPKQYQEKNIDRNQEKMPDPYRERLLDREQNQERNFGGNSEGRLETYPNKTAGKEAYGKKRSGKKRRKTETEYLGWNTEERDMEYLMEAEENREVFVRSESENKKRDTIIRLCQQGKSTLEIAKEMGLSMGEVKLMIDLYYVPEESKGTIK